MMIAMPVVPDCRQHYPGMSYLLDERSSDRLGSLKNDSGPIFSALKLKTPACPRGLQKNPATP
jgi:hypothetical protein